MKAVSLDIGASSGRFIVCEWKNERLEMQEVYRFNNGMVQEKNRLYWDIEALLKEVQKGLQATLTQFPDVTTIGIDTWAVDYGRLENNQIPSRIFAYRDERCKRSQTQVLSMLSYQTIYETSGIQQLPFNTIFQLADDVKENRTLEDILLVPDLIAYYLTGKKRCELTNVSTTALYNPVLKEISEDLCKAIHLTPTIFAPCVQPGERIGKIRDELCAFLKIPSIEVIAVASHDTASAIAGLKLDASTAYLSSGTWSLLGVERKEPCITKEAFQYNFTNEVGIDHSIRFLKNCMGLFIVQELVKDFQKKYPAIQYATIEAEIKKEKAMDVFLDVEDPLFQTPGDMLKKYQQYLAKTNQPCPTTAAGIVRTVYESMAWNYVKTVQQLETILQQPIQKICIIGGGSKSAFFNQMIANIVRKEVKIGEAEATVVGNAMVQLLYQNVFADVKDAREKLNQTPRVRFFPEWTDEQVEQRRTKYQRSIHNE